MAERRTTKAKTATKSGPASGRASTQRAASAPATKRRAAAKKGGAASGRRGAAKSGLEAKSVAEFRDALRKNVMGRGGIVMLSRDRIEEALNDAVKNGQITAKGARSIASDLVARGRKQTNDVLGDLEQLLGKGRDEIEGAAKDARKRAKGATKDARKRATTARGRATRAASPALAQADRARRAAGVGANFPITGYDDLNATQIRGRLSKLTPAELRKVRDHERRNANRKTILSAIETKLK